MPEKQLDSAQWHEAIIGKATAGSIASKILADDVPGWYKPVLDHTGPGGTALEFGSGTGILSGALAKRGRSVTLVDYSPESIEFCREVFRSAGLNGGFLVGDVLNKLPLDGASFDCVWSCGLLEHFSDADMIRILKESARLSAKYVISLVPNAYSLTYRLGKWRQEKLGIWQWGLEDPKRSLRRQFLEAGLKNISEFTIDPRTSNKFLYPLKPALLSRIAVRCLNMIPLPLLRPFRQGYLLVTIGEKS